MSAEKEDLRGRESSSFNMSAEKEDLHGRESNDEGGGFQESKTRSF